MADPKVPAGAATQTPEQIVAAEAAAKAAALTPEVKAKGIEFMLGAVTNPPKIETDDEKRVREAEEAAAAKAKKETDDKAAADAAAEGKEGNKDGDTAKKVTPAKKIIRRAKGYEDLEGDAATKLATAADSLTAAADKLAKGDKPAAAAPAPEPKATFSTAEKRELAVMAALKEVFPDKAEYKEIEKRAEKYLTELPAFEEKFEKDFADKWARQNASKEFESEDARDTAFNDARSAAFEKEQSKFKAKFNIEPDPDDFDEAKLALKTKPLQEQLSKTEKRLNELAQQRQREEAVEVAKAKSEQAVTDFASQTEKVIGAEFKDVIKDDGTLDTEKLEAIPDGDIIGEVLTDATDRAKNFSNAVAIAFRGGESDLQDQVVNFCLMEEARIAKLPAEQQTHEGKLFASRAAFAKMTPAQREKHWILDEDFVITRGNDVILDGAKQAIEAERAKVAERIKRRGLTPAPAKTAAKPASAEKPKSPAALDPTPAVPAANGVKLGENDFMTRLARGQVTV